MLVHVVNFWLKSGLDETDRKKFENGVSTLGTIEGVQFFNVGKPAQTDRPVIDRSYDYCLLTVFENLEAHDYYQDVDIHLKFIADCSHLWERVLIYDSESI